MSHSTSAGDGTTRPRRTDMQNVALIMGIVFLLVGILGFVPGITTQYDTLGVAGSGSMAMLLGLFMVSVLHNIVHLLFGVLGLAAARTYAASRAFLLYGGIVYAVLLVYGLVVPRDSSANVVPVNGADNALHAVLAIVMIGAAVVLSRRHGDVRASDIGAQGPR